MIIHTYARILGFAADYRVASERLVLAVNLSVKLHSRSAECAQVDRPDVGEKTMSDLTKLGFLPIFSSEHSSV